MWPGVIFLFIYATAMSFSKDWEMIIQGDQTIDFSQDQHYFKAKINSGNRIELLFSDSRLKISATSPRIWCLLFNEGQLIYPSFSQHGHKAEIEVDEGMEVFVTLFDGMPNALRDRINQVENPMTVDELRSQAWNGCTMVHNGFTRYTPPSSILAEDSFDAVGSIMFVFMAIAGFFCLGAYIWSINAGGPLENQWLDVNCRDGRSFSNRLWNQSIEWQEQMMSYCLNSSSRDCKVTSATSAHLPDCDFH